MSAVDMRHYGNGQPMSLAEAEDVLAGLAGVYLSEETALPPAFITQLLEQGVTLRGSEMPDIETRYRTLVEQIPAVVFMAFLDRGIGEAYVSPQIEEILGFTQEEWLNDPVRWYRQIHPDDRNRWNVEAAQMFLTGEPLRSVYKVMSRDGRIIWFHCEAKMVRRDDGRPWFIHGVAFDVSELKHAEAALKQAYDELELRVQERTAQLARTNAKLEQEITERKRAEHELSVRAQELARSNRELEQFAYVASHDLQEPLRMVTSFTQLLAERYRNQIDPNADEFIEYIVDGAKRMRQLINDLLEYSRVGTRGKPLVPIDCAKVFATVCHNLQSAITEAGARVTADPLPIVLGDETQLVQLFQNLVSNAIKFHGDRPIEVRVTAERQDGHWLFSIRDNGIGIDPQYGERIFIIFQRLHTRSEYSGTGIGLAICKKIVERHGGRIWVDSDLGKGSTFYFLLRAADGEAEWETED